MARPVAFALSDSGQMYRNVCQEFGVDPAAGIEDDVIRHNFRVALMLGRVKDEPESEATDIEQEWLEAARG